MHHHALFYAVLAMSMPGKHSNHTVSSWLLSLALEIELYAILLQLRLYSKFIMFRSFPCPSQVIAHQHCLARRNKERTHADNGSAIE